MCNLSEVLLESGREEGIKTGMQQERINAVKRMINAGITKGQIFSCGYTEEELAEAENILCTIS